MRRQSRVFHCLHQRAFCVSSGRRVLQFGVFSAPKDLLQNRVTKTPELTWTEPLSELEAPCRHTQHFPNSDGDQVPANVTGEMLWFWWIWTFQAFFVTDQCFYDANTSCEIGSHPNCILTTQQATLLLLDTTDGICWLLPLWPLNN